LARRATIFKQTSKESDFNLLIDAGGFTRGVGDRSKLISDYLLKGMDMLGYSAINLGVQDFSNGGEYLTQLQAQHKFDLLSANVFYKDSGKPFGKPYVIKEIPTQSNRESSRFDKITVGIIGACDVRSMLFSNQYPEPMLESRDPVPVIAPLVKELKKKTDIVVLLFHGRYDQLKKITESAPGIDVVVLGQEYYRVPTAQEAPPILLGVPSQGKYCGILSVELNDKRNIVSKNIEQITLSTEVSDDPQFAELVNEYKKAEEKQTGELSKPEQANH
jgi:2',3'-cyclic-nucleotide 2'-phosphodiesterase (5'-nucleotidase family)